ncbi:OmpA family protein [Wenzhouxiangella sp. XN24]|uniref:OmpA family protein n=1 Tax=Wenzhouxiangella sp. XN24 TaxID=2713569 RepID=UPI0013EBC768|nr:OmpA family protein [Wenzhouxiangella sp. XN24]NGX15732.1 OmpA family protein [Wenzhouxiangella sp. XN24]
MKNSILTLAVITSLAATPVLAAESSPTQARHNAIGIVAGGLLGAVIGGPPGLIAGMAMGGITSDQQLARSRVDSLESLAGQLRDEQRDLETERNGLQARVTTLGEALERQRDLAGRAAETLMLTDGLEFSIGFRSNSAAPPETLEESLAALATLVGAVPELTIQLDGYADPRGTAALNSKLSMQRAEAVRERLVAAGVDPQRIQVAGHGAVLAEGAAQADPDEWAMQRRVDVRLQSDSARRVVSRP